VAKTAIIYGTFYDVTCQKLTKFAIILRSYTKNKNDTFLKHGVCAKSCSCSLL